MVEKQYFVLLSLWFFVADYYFIKENSENAFNAKRNIHGCEEEGREQMSCFWREEKESLLTWRIKLKERTLRGAKINRRQNLKRIK